MGQFCTSRIGHNRVLLTRSLLRDPHVGHADYAPSAGDPQWPTVSILIVFRKTLIKI